MDYQNWLSRFAMIVPQHAAEPLTARYLTGDAADFFARIDRSVVERLVIALCVIMGQETHHGGQQLPLSEEDHSMEALAFQGAHETFDMGRQIRRAWRQPHGFNAGLLKRDPESLRELRVAIHKEVLVPAQESVFGVGQIPPSLAYPGLIGIRRAAREVHPS